jgi:hypothetical protein
MPKYKMEFVSVQDDILLFTPECPLKHLYCCKGWVACGHLVDDDWGKSIIECDYGEKQESELDPIQNSGTISSEVTSTSNQ